MSLNVTLPFKSSNINYMQLLLDNYKIAKIQ